MGHEVSSIFHSLPHSFGHLVCNCDWALISTSLSAMSDNCFWVFISGKFIFRSAILVEILF